MEYQSQTQLKESDNNFKSIQNAKKIVIFGTGNFGLIVLSTIKKINSNVVGFADNNKGNWGKKLGDKEIFSEEKIRNEHKDCLFIIASLMYPYIKKQLTGYGIFDYLDSDSLFSNLKLDLGDCGTDWSSKRCKEQIDTYMFAVLSEQNKKENKLTVKHLDLVLTEKCSLKCKDCSNLMQYYAKPVDEDFEVLKKSLNNFLSSVDFVGEIRLIGGEPLLYKKIGDVMELILKYNNYNKIYVYTNGTIVFKNNKMNVFQNEKVLFRISDYGKVSKNVKPLEEELSRLNVNYLTERVTRWQDCAKIKLYDRPKTLNEFIYGNCCVNQYLTLLHGKLYLCPFQAHAENLDAIPVNESQRIDLSSVSQNSIKEKISKLYFETECLEACKYCNGRDPNVDDVDAAIQATEPLQYQKVN